MVLMITFCSLGISLSPLMKQTPRGRKPHLPWSPLYPQCPTKGLPPARPQRGKSAGPHLGPQSTERCRADHRTPGTSPKSLASDGSKLPVLQVMSLTAGRGSLQEPRQT